MSKLFTMTHLYIDGEPEQFNEENPPGWLMSDEYGWWYKSHVLTLSVGESIETDFRRITRSK